MLECFVICADCSSEFNVKVRVVQGSVLNPLVLIFILKAMSEKFRTVCPRELLYADDILYLVEHNHLIRSLEESP